MNAKSSKSTRRLDGKSLRLLGLLVGLCGLIYLSWKPADPSLLKTSAPDGAQTSDPQDASQSNHLTRPPEAWLDALWNADAEAVARLLDQGMLANGVLDRRNTRPVHLLFFGAACQFGQSTDGVLPVLELLLSKGALVNQADQRGNTPLMLAAAECDGEVVRRLLRAGANVNATNALGLSAFELTLTNASATGRVLADAGYRLSPAQFAHYQALYHDELQVIEQLLLASPKQQ